MINKILNIKVAASLWVLLLSFLILAQKSEFLTEFISKKTGCCGLGPGPLCLCTREITLLGKILLIALCASTAYLFIVSLVKFIAFVRK